MEYVAEDGFILDLVRRRKLPIIGNGGGVWSFLHMDDAAGATMAAIERGAPGVYNIADDEPGVSMFTQIRGVVNAKAKRELDWKLLYPSWREGFRRGLSDPGLRPGDA